jgi:sterol desaturase/sphingolipid hydroxylase (fatty acid hydroxylase superfamily)
VRSASFLLTPALVAALFLSLALIERAIPLRATRLAIWGHLAVNVTLSLLTFLVSAAFVRPAALAGLRWASDRPFGLLHLAPLPAWAGLVAGFLLLDLSFYYWHIANHKLPLLWRFHNVHHADPELDVSTGFRFHFGEVLLSVVFRVLQVTLLGVSFAAFAAYELVFQANTLFHHSNTRLPIRLERRLNRILVTPRMHGIHHSQIHRETDSNYGVVFSWWDRFHRTIGLNVPQSRIEIGVPGYTGAEANRLGRLLVMPFERQRDYWRRPDGTVPERATGDLHADRGVLAE